MPAGDQTSSGEVGEHWIGRTIDGRYRIESILGTGGLGVVYQAEHVGLGRAVAIKVLHPHLGRQTDLLRRFAREMKLLSALANPHVVTVTDNGIADGVPYLVMELLEGENLFEVLHERRFLPIDEVLTITRQMLLGLASAHERGVVHRDLKPANVFLQHLPGQQGWHIKVLDFGLGKLVGPEDSDLSMDPTLTAGGTILGTPSYMAPEQAAAADTDARADVYSVGVILYEMLCGQPPFTGASRADVIHAHLREPVPPPEDVRPGLSLTPRLASLLKRALAKERTARFDDAAEMLEAVDALPTPAATFTPTTKPPPVPARPMGPPSGHEPTVSVTSSMVQTAIEPGDATKRKRRLPWFGLSIFLVGGVALAGALYFVGRPLPKGAQDLLAAGAPVDGADDAPHDGAGSEADSEEPEAAVPASGDTEAGGAEASVAESPEAESSDAEADETERGEIGSDEVGEDESDADLAPTTPETERVPARDPFRARLPRELRAARNKVRREISLTREEVLELRRFQRTHADDARPSLLIARDYKRRGFLTDALTRYRLAHALDPSSRGDPVMKRDLLELVTNETVGERAADLIVEIYGGEATADLERLLAKDMPEEEKARLQALRARLP